jgi:hypothetical protein
VEGARGVVREEFTGTHHPVEFDQNAQWLTHPENSHHVGETPGPSGPSCEGKFPGHVPRFRRPARTVQGDFP